LLYGRALGLSHGEAEDVLQDTFLGLIRLETTPREPAHYCVRAYRNRALNLRRGLLRRLARELESKSWFDCQADVDPRERAAVECLQVLSAEQREVVVLKIWHGYTFVAIGELTGVSPNTAAGRYRYAMDRLRTAFEQPQAASSTEPAGSTELAAPGKNLPVRPAWHRGISGGDPTEIEKRVTARWTEGDSYEFKRYLGIPAA
jgi:RNA polymerase sigma-70 factor (ECF subfamily)